MKAIFIHAILLVLACSAEAAALNVEEQLQLLQAKVNQLEFQVQQHEILAEKLARLELVLAEMQNERKTSSSPASVSPLHAAIPRTCREAKFGDPTLSSGMYWIDPDGQGTGDSPIYVYCDMTKGSTSILHDSESPMNVGHCTDPGCYTRPVNYNASIRQITALAQLSNECHQSIKYDCNFAPFELNDVAFGWWNDKDGNSKYFWSGGNTDIHTCHCGIDSNCVESYIKCNCDAAAPVQLSDDGVITDKSILPITRLNFGRTQLDTSSGVHTLGRFECTGQVAVNGMPTSCEDLWRIGHTMSGLYSVMGADMVESVYCDFTKLPNDAGFQTWIGFTDVKSSPAYFYAQRSSNSERSSHFNQVNVPIPFDIAKVNIGGAMDSQTGKFTAPRSGTYFFSLSGLTNIPASSSTMGFWIGLYLNGNRIGSGYSVEISTASQLKPFSLQSTLNLEAGDQVWAQIWQLGDPTGVYIYDDNNHYTHFNGWLLQENISKSLNAMQMIRHDLF